MLHYNELIKTVTYDFAESSIRKTRSALFDAIGGGTRSLTPQNCSGIAELATVINQVGAEYATWNLSGPLNDLEGFINANSGGNPQLSREALRAPYTELVGRSLETIPSGKAGILSKIIELAKNKNLPLAEMAQSYSRLAGNTKLQPSEYVLALPMIENITQVAHDITTENTTDIAALGDFFGAMETIATRLDERGEQFSGGLIEHLSRFIERDGALAQNIPIIGKDRSYSSLIEFRDSLKKQKERSAIVMKTQAALQTAQEAGPESREPVMLQLMDDLENSREKAGVYCITFYPDSENQNKNERVIMLKPMEVEGSLTLKPLENGNESQDESKWKQIQTKNTVCYLLTRNGVVAYAVTQIPDEQLERPDLIPFKDKLIQQNSSATFTDARVREAFTTATQDGGSLANEQERSIFAKKQFSQAANYIHEQGNGIIDENGNVEISGAILELTNLSTVAYSYDQLCQVANPQLFIKALEKSLS